MTYGIYGFFSTADEQCLYVGQTADSFETRCASHLKLLKNGKHPRAEWVIWFQNQGSTVEAMEFRKLFVNPPLDQLNALEIEAFEFHSPQFYGQKPSLDKRWGHSSQTRKKISLALRREEAWTLGDCEYEFCSSQFRIRKVQKKKYCSGTCSSKARYGYKPVTAEVVDLAVELRAAGNTWKQISDALGVCYKELRIAMNFGL